jgi:mannose-6-phosphate isomerase-like protein (cupin superfamily)
MKHPARLVLAAASSIALLAAGFALGRLYTPAAALHAEEAAPEKPIRSGVFQWADLAEKPAGDTGTARIYCEGVTGVTEKFATGSFTLEAGKEPHPPHKHIEEEILIVTEGEGLIHLNGKEIPAKKGTVMYSEAWDVHGIRNTGKEPLHFYFMKWTKKR